MSKGHLRELAAATDRACALLWVLRSPEPEILQLIERRGSRGYAHYLTSRLGLLPEVRWAPLVRVVPPSLVEHLLPRCRELDPRRYVEETLEAAAGALRRRHSQPLPPDLGPMTRGPVAGEIAAAFAALPRSGDPHREFLVDAMTLREERSHLHYQAGEERGWSDLQLMLLNAAWRGRPPLEVAEQFRWPEGAAHSELAALVQAKLVDAQGRLTPRGREQRELLEGETDSRVSAALAGRGISDRAAAAAAARLAPVLAG